MAWKMIFEDAYTHYDAKLKLKTLGDYLSKIPKNNATYVKMAIFRGADAVVCNITDIMISKEIADGEAATTENKPLDVVIQYSKKADVPAMTCKRFSDLCKKIFDELKDVDAESVSVASALLGSSRKPGPFRFYYDDSTNTALFVRYVNPKGVEEFIKAHQADFAKEVKSSTVAKKVVKKAPKADAKKSADNVAAAAGEVNADVV